MTDDTAAGLPAIQRAESAGQAMIYNPSSYEHGWRLAQMFHASGMVPKHLNKQACFVGITIAEQLELNPLMVLQNIYEVHGTIGWSSKFLIALANRSNVFRGPIRWDIDGKGNGLRVTAWAKLADDGERVEFTASMEMASAEGWTKNPKYRSMPELMLRYRSATLLVRLYAPEVMMGLPMVDEVEDVSAAVNATPPRTLTQTAADLGLSEPETVEAEEVHESPRDALIQWVCENPEQWADASNGEAPEMMDDEQAIRWLSQVGA